MNSKIKLVTQMPHWHIFGLPYPLPCLETPFEWLVIRSEQKFEEIKGEI